PDRPPRILLPRPAFPCPEERHSGRSDMRKILIALAALTLLAGCETRQRVGVGVVAGGPDYYDGYYDGFYGPFYDGYWGTDGAFWYSDGGHNWHRDDGHHFGHAAGGGGHWNHVHGTGARREH